jgi:hypothetical protein
MHRLLAKLVITALVILGEGVFASESTLRNDGCLEAGGINAQPLLQPHLDGTESLQDPDVQASGAVSQDSDLPLKVQAVFNTHSYGLPGYHAFNPRAPPFPASWRHTKSIF